MVNDKEKLEELFATWLAKNAPSARLTDLYLCYSEIEAYCFKTKVLRQPLFDLRQAAVACQGNDRRAFRGTCRGYAVRR